MVENKHSYLQRQVHFICWLSELKLIDVANLLANSYTSSHLPPEHFHTANIKGNSSIY